MTLLAVSTDDRQRLIETSKGQGYIEDPMTGTRSEEKAIIALLSANIEWVDPPIEGVELMASLLSLAGPPREGLVPQSGDPERPVRWVRPKEGDSEEGTKDVKEHEDFGDDFRQAALWQWDERQKLGLSQDQVKAVQRYTVDMRMNAYLRGSIDLPSDVSQEMDEAIESVKAVGALYSLPKDRILYRGARMPTEVMNVGSVYTDKGFASTGLSSAQMSGYSEGLKAEGYESIEMVISAAAGTQGAFGEQGEFILMPDTRFKIDHIAPPSADGPARVSLTVLS